jgi:hypothetical protein
MLNFVVDHMQPPVVVLNVEAKRDGIQDKPPARAFIIQQ